MTDKTDRAKRLLYMAYKKLEKGSPKNEVIKLVQSTMDELNDPFAGELNQFLTQKESEEAPQEQLKEKLEEEGGGLAEEALEDMKDSPQEQLEEKLSEEKPADPVAEEGTEEVAEDEDKKVDAADTTNEDDKLAQSKLNKIASDLKRKGYPLLATKLLAISEYGIVDILNSLLMAEYRQRDFYEAYDYLLFGAASLSIQEHLREHVDAEMEHIKILQRYIVGFGGEPTLDRHTVPGVEASLENILRKDLELEREAVRSYSTFLKGIEGKEEYIALKVDVETILSAEMEHVHDLENLLKKP